MNLGIFYSISLFCFVSGCFWILFLFPAVSIITGELKPRQLYVDENALLVHRGLKINNKYNINNNTNDILSDVTYESLCNYMSSLNIDCRVFDSKEESDDSRKITQIIVDAEGKSTSLEATVLIIAFIPSNGGIITSPSSISPSLFNSSNSEELAINLGLRIVHMILRADWLSKRILLLFVPIYCLEETALEKLGILRSDICIDNEKGSNIDSHSLVRGVKFSHKLEAWLRLYTNPTSLNSQHQFSTRMNKNSQKQIPLHAGLLRDAYVVDLLGFNASKGGENDINGFGDTREFVYETVELLVIGSKNQLPNMDLLSMSLAVIPFNSVLVEGQSRVRESMKISKRERPTLFSNGKTFEDFLMKSDLPLYVIIFLKAYRVVLQFGASFFPLHGQLVGELELYFERLIDLYEFGVLSTKGSSGLHAQFNSRNIDSISLRPIPADSRSEQLRITSPRKDVDSFLGILWQLIRASSNLHGATSSHTTPTNFILFPLVLFSILLI